MIDLKWEWLDTMDDGYCGKEEPSKLTDEQQKLVDDFDKVMGHGLFMPFYTPGERLKIQREAREAVLTRHERRGLDIG